MSDQVDIASVNAILSGEFTPTKKKRTNTLSAALEYRGNIKQSRKRVSPITQIDITDTYDAFDKFKKRRDSLRLSASSVAALAGFHPYSNLPKLLMDLVYQGQIGHMLLKHDAKLLNIDMISEEEALRQLSNKAGSEVKKAFKQAIDVSKGRVSVRSVQCATAMKDHIISTVKQSETLSKGEAKILENAARYNVNTGFGKDHEEDALDLYEKQCGWEVRCRNEDRKCWDFQRLSDGTVVPSGPAQSYSIAMRKSSKADDVPCVSAVITIDAEGDEEEKDGHHINVDQRKSDNGSKSGRSLSESIDVDYQNSVDDVTSTAVMHVPRASKPSKQANKKAKRDKPFFSILGVADGIRDELFNNSPEPTNNNGLLDDDNWALRQVVVECKHRMASSFNPPPIYDQIQTVVYCMMYDTCEGEIVQVVRNKSQIRRSASEGGDQRKVDSNEDTEDVSKVQKTSITSSRVSLDDSIMQHRINWYSTILPRLQNIVTAVYDIRSSDDKRYRMIIASALASSGGDDSDWWQIIFDECPWLKECDISFSK